MSEFLEFAANHWLLVAGIIGVFILIVMEEITAFSGSKYMLDPEAAAIFIQKGGKIKNDFRNKSCNIGNFVCSFLVWIVEYYEKVRDYGRLDIIIYD